MAEHREFGSGATRDTDNGKPDYEGALSPAALERFAQYMLKHCDTSHGKRSTDNWQKGIPKSAYIKSAFRHLIAWWKCHRGGGTVDDLEEALCGLLFNVQGYLHEHLKEKQR